MQLCLLSLAIFLGCAKGVRISEHSAEELDTKSENDSRPIVFTLQGSKKTWSGQVVLIEDVKDLPNPTQLQADMEQYIQRITGEAPRTPMFGPLDSPDVFKVIGNPSLRPNGKVVAEVLNAGKGWNPTHEFDTVDEAVDFFRETGAVNRDFEILINAHMRTGSDAVHELVHSYHGSDGRWDWYFNEGLTDWFSLDFAATLAGSCYHYKGGRTYAQGVSIVSEIAAVLGKRKLAKLFFGNTDPGPFKQFAKEVSMILLQRQIAKDNRNGYRFYPGPGPWTRKYAHLLGGSKPPPLPSESTIKIEAEKLRKKLGPVNLPHNIWAFGGR